MSRPSRADYYAMQTAAEIRYAHRNRPAGWKLENMMVKFEDRAKTPAARAEQSRSRWAMHVGVAAVATLSKDEAARLDRLNPEEAARERRRRAQPIKME